MRAALDRVDQIGEAEQAFDVFAGVLKSHLDGDVVLGAAHDDGLGREQLLAVVEVLDELVHAALVMVRPGLALRLVDEDELEPGDQEGHLAEAIAERLGRERHIVEDRRVGLEGDGGAALFSRRAAGEIGDGDAALKTLVPFAPVAADGDFQPLGERVDDRNADAVQTAGDLVIVVVELAARVQHGEHHFERRTAVGGVRVDGDAAAVVGDADALIRVQRDGDLGAETGQRLVDGVVDDFVNAVMQSARRGVADVHARPLADRIEPFEDLDVFGCVLCAHEFSTSCCKRGSSGWSASFISSR